MKRDYNDKRELASFGMHGIKEFDLRVIEVHKSGTGAPRRGIPCVLTGMLLILALLICAPAMAAQSEPDALMVLIRGETVAISFEAEQGVVIGSVAETAGSDNYYQVILFVQDPGSGAHLLVKGSGSGVASASSCEDFGILVKGSGSGTASHGPCSFDHPNAWGFAEIAVEQGQTLVTIHRVENGQATEYASLIID